MATTPTNGTTKTTTTANPFGVFADCMTESVRAGFDMNKRMVETWTKSFTAQPFSPEMMTTRFTNFWTGVTNQTTKTMTDMTNLMVEQVKVSATMVERLAKTTGTAMTNAAPKTMPTETRDIVTDAFEATAKNTERLTRMGLTSIETVTGLVEEVTTAGATNGR